MTTAQQATDSLFGQHTRKAVPLPAPGHIPAPTIGLPVSKPNANSKKAADAAMKASGEAIADELIRTEAAHGARLMVYLTRLAQLSQAGRTGFRVTIKDRLDAERSNLQMLKGNPKQGIPEDPDYAIRAREVRSMTTRVSELVTFSKAVDQGFGPDNYAGADFYRTIALARAYLTGDSAGPTQKRGRPATPFLDKLKKFLSENAETDKDLNDAAKLAANMAKLKAVKADETGVA